MAWAGSWALSAAWLPFVMKPPAWTLLQARPFRACAPQQEIQPEAESTFPPLCAQARKQRPAFPRLPVPVSLPPEPERPERQAPFRFFLRHLQASRESSRAGERSPLRPSAKRSAREPASHQPAGELPTLLVQSSSRSAAAACHEQTKSNLAQVAERRAMSRPAASSPADRGGGRP